MTVAVPFVRGGKYDTFQNNWEKSLVDARSSSWQRDQPPGLCLHVIFNGKKFAENFAAWIEAGHEKFKAREGLEESDPFFKDYAEHFRSRRYVEEEEKEMLEFLNDLRKKAGLAPVDTLDESCQFYIPKKTKPGEPDVDLVVAANIAKRMMEYSEDALPSVVLEDSKMRVSGLFMARVHHPASAEAKAAVRRATEKYDWTAGTV